MRSLFKIWKGHKERRVESDSGDTYTAQEVIIFHGLSFGPALQPILFDSQCKTFNFILLGLHAGYLMILLGPKIITCRYNYLHL